MRDPQAACLAERLQAYALWWRRPIGDKEILDQILAGIDPIAIEIADAILGQERIVDQEIAAEVFRLSEDRIGRVGKDLRRAADRRDRCRRRAGCARRPYRSPSAAIAN